MIQAHSHLLRTNGDALRLKFLNAQIQNFRKRYHTGRYRKVAALLKQGSLLDIGCGQPCETMPDGSFLRFVGHETGVDLKPCAIPFPFHQADITHLPFPDQTFDNVVAMEILEHVPDPAKALQEISRVLKKEGTAVVSFPEQALPWKLFWHVWERPYGFLWRHTHTGTYPVDDWLPLLSRVFVCDKPLRHWRFNLIFRLYKK